jgi:hypothetical protein
MRTLEIDIYRWFRLGARDVLLLSYKGDDSKMHLSLEQDAQLVASVERLRRHFAGKTTGSARFFKSPVVFKVDVCWGQRLDGLPQLLAEDDCGASASFLSIGSDKTVAPCSFHHQKQSFDSFDEIPAIYQRFKSQKTRANERGCGRLA